MPTPPRAALAVPVLLTLVLTGLPLPAGASAATDPCSQTGAIIGTSTADNLVGTAGDDIICGLGGRDTISGLGGNDILVGGNGDDLLYGGPGDDQLIGGLGADRMDGGTGIDLVSYADRAAPVTVTLAPTTTTGPGDDGEAGERDRADISIEQVVGGSGNDDLTGDDSANALTGGDGNDRLTGAGGADQLRGGPGNDTLVGGAGVDDVRCGQDLDHFSFDSTDTRWACERNLTPGTGNVVVGIGDSNMATGQQGYFPDAATTGMPLAAWPGYVDTLSVLSLGTALAGGRAMYGGTFGVAGAFTATIFGDQLTRALALQPRAIFVVAGTNNITAGGSYITTAKNDYRAGCARMVAAGVLPILSTTLPRNDGREAANAEFNAWLRNFAATSGYPLADFNAVLADPTGRFLPGTNRDALHLAEPGVNLAAAELAKTFRARLPEDDVMLTDAQGAGLPAGSLFANPLFLDDANADGRPDGVAGTGLAVTTTTDTAHADGRLMKVAHTGTEGSANIGVAAAPGARIYVAGRLRTKVQSAGGVAFVRAYARPSGTLLWEVRLGRDLPTGSVLPPFVFTVPPSLTSTTSVQLVVGEKTGGQLELGQFTVIDLGAAG